MVQFPERRPKSSQLDPAAGYQRRLGRFEVVGCRPRVKRRIKHCAHRVNEPAWRRFGPDRLEIFLAGLIVVAIEERNRTNQELPGRKRAAMRYLRQSNLLVGHWPACDRTERFVDGRRCLPEAMLRREGCATGECCEIRYLVLNGLF